ncbi:AraC family transcriptional regulator [Candidatus Rhodobacter oscarellae]|uniref:AraC family transcriptional regulator n=1 Tax=Candidatus Rhodobacter oscarellae TaxID=1675527 RepID=UPI00067113DD|nr:AraC family transcriptional regulator [Candidatus Rhodobacter lobularis]
MSDLATIPSNLLYYTFLELKERGVALERLPQWNGTINPLLNMQRPRIAFAQSQSLIEQAITLADDPCFGLAVGMRQKFATSGLLSAGLLASQTCGDAVLFGLRYHHLTGSMLNMSLVELDEGEHAINVTARDPSSPINSFLTQELFANLAQMAQFLYRSHRPFKQMDLIQHEPQSRRFRDVLGITPNFRAAYNRIVFSKSAWTTPLETADPFVLSGLVPVLDALALEEGEQQTFLSHVEGLMLAGLNNELSMRILAGQLGMSERTLRRKLDDAGTSFTRILDQVRRARALELLLQSNEPLDRIAAQLGFDDTRSLRRRLRDWTGHSAAELRAGKR